MEHLFFREERAHGDAVFPFNIYPCAIPEMLTEVLTHWHDDFEIVYVKKGRGRVTVERESRELSAPALVFILPGQLHAISQMGREHMEYENIIFHPSLLAGESGNLFDPLFLEPIWDGAVRIPTFFTGEDSQFSVLAQILDACDEEAEKRDRFYPLFVKGQLLMLCHRLLTLCPRMPETELTRSAPEQIKPALSYIHANYGEKIRIKDVAGELGFSEAHFMHFFKENMGCSFITYLNEYRLARAEAVLRTSGDSVLNIAQETGFSNFSYFIRLFKSKYGTTPLKYRKLYGRLPVD